MADKAALSLRARELDLFLRCFEDCKDIDTGVNRLVRWIKEAVTQNIPLSKPASFSVPWWSSEHTQLVRNARIARREHWRWPCAEAWRAYPEALSAKGEAIKKAKAVHFRQAVADGARGRREIWALAIWAKERSHLPLLPRPSPTLSPQPALL
jgi:hypothetical protein